MQIKLVREIIDAFYYKKRHKLYISAFLSLIASCFEYLGLFLIFQFFMITLDSQNTYTVFLEKIFKNFFYNSDRLNYSLILGILCALIYILKNIYMLIYTKINNFIMQDLFLNIRLKLVKNILYSDFVLVNSIPNDEKLCILSKVDIVVWEYVIQYFNLIVNIAIIIVLIIFLFVKFTLCAIISFCFLSILSFIEYKILKNKSNYQNEYYGKYLDSLNKVLYVIINAIKEIRLNNKSGYFLYEAREKIKNIAKIQCLIAQNRVFHIYFTEISIMITFIFILIILYYTTGFDNKTVISALGTIVAVILRINPAVNRTQSAIYGINSNENIALDLIKFNNKFKDTLDLYETSETLPFKKEIRLENIS